MAARAQPDKTDSVIAARWSAFVDRFTQIMAGAVLMLVALCFIAALASYNAADPSWNMATSAEPSNWLGNPGAVLSDLVYQGLGLGAWALAIPPLFWGLQIVRGQNPRWRRNTFLAMLGAFWLSFAASWATPWSSWPIGSGLGGVFGLLGTQTTINIAALWSLVPFGWAFAVPSALIGFALAGWSLGLSRQSWLNFALWWRRPSEEEQTYRGEPAPKALSLKREPRLERQEETDEEPTSKSRTRIAAAPAKTKVPTKPAARQGALDLGDTYDVPSLDLLAPPTRQDGRAIDRAALEQNARLLETVLEDYGVRGEIIQVRPGPVVTMYELEPAAGIKSSRVIGLTDDIARSMSAVSARVAVVPGRNVIGIELPNVRRETVFLRELLTSDAFTNDKQILPLVLGKDISGEPVITDLAPMPHLLIAGTTGSGKSVGLNAMILSLLYRMSPDQLRFIMIDPKMLELSVYDGIPHLLSPVVTEPKKAIIALKWAVREMDDRYRKMASVNARSLAGFNDKVIEAKSRGQSLVRRVHTGYDRETGQPLYEEQTFDFEPLPLIVVVVDELADLMIVAGKEVEVLIQRLAQKARAAGIHLIMATQRPSVDVITGVIKANLPTRISFQVTSKIDSRTILGEQGAEQLLGRGDMLYMAGGKQIVRVHGPFVTEEEVERVADHWRAQGMPDYVEAVTEEPEEDVDGLGLSAEDEGEEGNLYRRAVQIVAESQKASTSYLQRQLRVGYNSAARLIEQMEKEGLVGAPDHVGRREVFLDRDGSRL